MKGEGKLKALMSNERYFISPVKTVQNNKMQMDRFGLAILEKINQRVSSKIANHREIF